MGVVAGQTETSQNQNTTPKTTPITAVMTMSSVRQRVLDGSAGAARRKRS